MGALSRQTGIPVLSQIPWGAHICLFYETKQDLLDSHVAYFKAGLQANERCLWAISDPVTERDARDALSQGVPDFARHLAEGRIEFLSGREWYLKGNEFDLQRITGGWHEKLRAALADGFEGMRVSGNAFWLATEHWDDFLQYEHELDRLLAGQAMIVLCTYSLGASRAMDVLDVARAHDVAVARRKGVWEIIETFEPNVEPTTLTGREREVLGWVVQGKSAWEIGEILRIKKRTVDEHVQRATRKLGATNRTQAAAIAIRDRIVDPGVPSQ
jgi:DNA-binding CsgD family transcriptional regulator